MATHERLPRPFIFFSACVATLGVLALFEALRLHPLVPSIQLGLVLAALLVSELYLLQVGSYRVSLAMPLILTAVVVAGPGAACFGAAISSVSLNDYRERRPISLLAFNFGQLILSTALAGKVYLALGGSVLVQGRAVPLSAGSTPSAILGLLTAAFVFNGLNMLLMSLGMRLGRGVPFSAVFRDLLASLPTGMALAVVALLMAQVLAINPVGFPLFLFPLFLARQVYQRFANLRDAYLDMVRSLVGALEAKDSYTRGHSERVAAYARELAYRAGSDTRVMETVEQAALLHDIGKLSLPFAVLSKPARLTDEEYDSVRRHPTVGGEMVGRIPGLRKLSEPIMAHHERIDGSGYPNGMQGDQIPFVARVLAIADAYDAMTTHRAYRSAMTHEMATAELLTGAGRQFDERLVQVFIHAGIGQSREQSWQASAGEGSAGSLAS